MKFWTKEELEKEGYTIKNNVIKAVDVSVLGHFGNCCCLQILCENVIAMSQYNNTGNLGLLIKTLVDLLDLTDDNGIRISDIKNAPVRLVFEGEGGWGDKCIGFGNFMKDKFVLTDEFVRLSD